ncbi:hypothetical protein P618_200750 [Holospora obtusa F1]|uniref:Uncharacterized protein n=1 Tax=Holospora obtusa F1 TaxID=1399147 RepID=W6TDG4_HOLOB|nr:hypothetical protein [Holospora obtusa]ETZ07068.1 hypothetical protein P618_200750 [Holospora obtusa F1]
MYTYQPSFGVRLRHQESLISIKKHCNLSLGENFQIFEFLLIGTITMLSAKKFCIVNAILRLSVTYIKFLKHPKANQKKFTFFQKGCKAKKEGQSKIFTNEIGFIRDIPKVHEYSIERIIQKIVLGRKRRNEYYNWRVD